jgi:hypothetical protein
VTQKRDDIDAALDQMEELQQWFSVVGCWPETKERYMEVVPAASPRQAEDLAQITAQEKGGVLWVCAVFEGKLTAADTYAVFIDPDQTTAAEF